MQLRHMLAADSEHDNVWATLITRGDALAVVLIDMAKPKGNDRVVAMTPWTEVRPLNLQDSADAALRSDLSFAEAHPEERRYLLRATALAVINYTGNVS